MLERLAQAEQLVSDSERQVSRLRDMLAEFRRQALDAQPVMNLLNQFEQGLAGSIANRDRLRKELGL